MAPKERLPGRRKPGWINLLVFPGNVIEDRMSTFAEPLLVEYVQTLYVLQVFFIVKVPSGEHIVKVVAAEVHAAPSDDGDKKTMRCNRCVTGTYPCLYLCSLLNAT